MGVVLANYRLQPNGGQVIWQGKNRIVVAPKQGTPWVGTGTRQGSHLVPPSTVLKHSVSVPTAPVLPALLLGGIFLAVYAAVAVLPPIVMRVRSALQALQAGAASLRQGGLKEQVQSWRDRQKKLQAQNRRLARRPLGQRITRFLERAGSRLLPVEFILLLLGCAVAGEVAGGLLLGGLPGGILGFILGPLLVILSFRVRFSRRRKAFEASLAELLRYTANALKAGSSTMQAFDDLQESPGTVGVEFGRVMREYRVGIALPDSLAALADRVGSRDLDRVAMVISVQQQTGGNLADLFLRNADTIRDRLAMRGKIRAMTAQGRMSAWVMGLLPVGLFVFFFVTGRVPAMMSGIGAIMLMIAVGMEIVGALVLWKMLQLE